MVFLLWFTEPSGDRGEERVLGAFKTRAAARRRARQFNRDVGLSLGLFRVQQIKVEG